MTFEAYLENVKAKTGKTPDDFKQLAAQKGLVKHKEILDWLKADFGLGTGHARAIAEVILHANDPEVSLDDQIAKHFSGAKANWRKVYDNLIKQVKAFGPDVEVSPTSAYISLVRKDKKFGIVQVSSNRLDVGIKLKGVAPRGRFTEAGKWNAMVTHRVQIERPEQIDEELISWLRQAYDNA